MQRLVARCCTSIYLVMLVLVTNVGGAAAQQTVGSAEIAKRTVQLGENTLASLRGKYRSGDSDRVIALAQEVLRDLASTKISNECCDLRKRYFLVMFVVPDVAGTSAATLVIVLVHQPAPDTIALPGLEGGDHPMYEVFLADDLSTTIRGTYTVEREEDPLLKQSGEFASALIGRFALPTSTVAVAAAVQTGAKRSPIAVTFKRVVLPYARAKITVRQVVTYPSPVEHIGAVAASLNVEQRLGYDPAAVPYRPMSDAERQACMQFSDDLRQQVMTTLGSQCQKWPLDDASSSTCLKNVLKALNDTFSQSVTKPGSCPANEAFGSLQQYVRVVQDLKPVTGTSTLSNRPPTRFGFGLAAAYLAHVDVDNNHPRTKIQSGKLAVDPFTRLLTMGVVNLTPWGYDSKRFSPSAAERFRFFMGAAFAPYFGATFGAAWELNRYLGMNVGYARLWFDTPKSGERLNEAPSAANTAAPFELSSTGAWFFGVGYNLK